MSQKTNGKILAALAAVILIFAGAVYAGEYSPYQSPGKTFRCEVPTGWSVVESPEYRRELTKADGFDAFRGDFEDRVSISVRYFPEGNQLHRDMDAYINSHCRPLVGPREGFTYGRVEDMDLKGAKAKTFERTGFDYESHVYNQKLGTYVEPLHPRKVAYTEKFIVAPAKGGFVAFRCKARPDTAGRYQETFSRVVDSFLLLDKK